MSPEDFIPAYERALATQQWAAVEPLVHRDVCVTFSTGTVHKGLAAVQAAFEANFAAIDDETYRIENVHWVLCTDVTAVFLFDFHWAGRIDGCDASGAGRGTSVLICEGDVWKLIAEHLGPAPCNPSATSTT